MDYWQKRTLANEEKASRLAASYVKRQRQALDNTNLHKAKVIKNDEFYTQLDDIAKEVKNYKKRFSGKSVFCNCNDKPSNNFFKYFLTQFDVIGLTKLVAIEYVEGGHGIKYTVENDLYHLF